MQKLLYCLMYARRADGGCDVDVEVFRDTPESRRAWLEGKDACGTDDLVFRSFEVRELMRFDYATEAEALAYLDGLRKNFSMTSVHDIK